MVGLGAQGLESTSRQQITTIQAEGFCSTCVYALVRRQGSSARENRSPLSCTLEK